MTVFWVVVAILVVAIVTGGFAFIGLARRRKQLDEAWADIDAELKHRHEMVSSLLNAALAFAAPKDDVLRPVAQARREAVIAGTTGDPARISRAENSLNACLRTFFKATEEHPMLRSAAAFTGTRDGLKASEATVLAMCERFNAAAKSYDTAVGRFPRSLFARCYGFGRVAQYRTEGAAAVTKERELAPHPVAATR